MSHSDMTHLCPAPCAWKRNTLACMLVILALCTTILAPAGASEPPFALVNSDQSPLLINSLPLIGEDVPPLDITSQAIVPVTGGHSVVLSETGDSSDVPIMIESRIGTPPTG